MGQLHLKAISELAQAARDAALGQSAPVQHASELDRFFDAYRDVGALESYRHVPRAARDMVEAVSVSNGESAARCFLRSAVGHAVMRLIDSGELMALPPRIQAHHAKQLMRIATSVQADDQDWRLSNDRLLKDLGLATLRLLAAASQVLDLRCGISRSLLFRQGLTALPRVAVDFARLGGFKPYIQIHTHLSYLDEFNDEGRRECYRCCADLYSIRPDLLGMFGASWYYDPAVRTISPRLAHLLDVPLAGGCKHWFVERGGESIENATSTSPSRMKLYKDGKYMPSLYMIVWGRAAQLDWVRRNP